MDINVEARSSSRRHHTPHYYPLGGGDHRAGVCSAGRGEMVKFSKQFEGQLVPEWKDAFVDYWHLKKDLKKMHTLGGEGNSGGGGGGSTKGKKNKTRASSLASNLLSPLGKLPLWFGHGQKDHEAIQVHKKLASSQSKGDLYETELLEQFADTEAAKDFFARLDAQLNKVNQFYRAKEKEFLERGESLKKQMGILVELKAALKQQPNNNNGSSSHGQSQREDPSVSFSNASEEESVKGPMLDEQQQGGLAWELGRTESSSQLTESCRFDEESGSRPAKARLEECSSGKLRSASSNGRVISCQGKSVKINIPLTTPSRTISALSYLVWEDLVSQSKKGAAGGGGGAEGGGKLNVNKAKLKRAEKMIRGAFVELFKGLGYLSTYRNLNMMAFAKILKKFDKATGKQVLPIYLKVVECSYFNVSDKAIKLMDEVEEIFVKHFAEDDRRKAMKFLKPHQRKESHAVTFFIGLFAGCFIALFAGYCIMAHIAGMYTGQSDSVYMETVYPVLSMFSLLFLHLFLYGCNIFMWRKARINYVFIFEFFPTKELKYRDVFLICSASMAAVVGVLFAHLSLTAKGYSSTEIQAIPGLLLLSFLVILLCPFDIIYRSSRYHFLKVIRNIVLTPLYKVVMVDFFMADQLCSQVPMLRNLEYVACYYITGSYKTQDYGFCNRTANYRDLAYAVSFLPYYWRAMQCARRWFDEGDMNHLVNLGKYVSAMLAAGAKVAYEKDKNMGYLSLVIIMSSIATVYQLYWDFVKDWGLLQFDSKNPWLRNELILRRKFVYYISMGLNLVLRLVWLQTVLHSSFGSLDYRVVTFFLAALEVIRRGQWNFYRLENEHLNNAGKFRAVKTVPLPFHEVDED